MFEEEALEGGYDAARTALDLFQAIEGVRDRWEDESLVPGFG